MTTRVITNLVPRELIDGFSLSASEREQFDYLDWPGIDAGTESASFFRYRGELYDLGNFMRAESDGGLTDESVPANRRQWDGYAADSFFSATAVRMVADDYGDNLVIVARIYS